jgi:hypothetical protein
MTKQELIDKQKRQQEDIDWLNAHAPKPATWTIGKELGENGAMIAFGLQKAGISPRKDTEKNP